MEYVNFGSSGLRVSRLALGMGLRGQGDEGAAERLIRRALRGARDEVVITSKVFSRVGPGPNDQGASRYHIMREVERSLRRLGTDRIDVYLLHGFDAATPLEEQLRTLDDLVRQGK